MPLSTSISMTLARCKEPFVIVALVGSSNSNFGFETVHLEDRTLSFALQQSTKALASLRQSMVMENAYTSSSARIEAGLVTCVMLVSLALFQCDIKTTISHLQSGYGVLMQWRKANFNGNTSGHIIARVFREPQLHRFTNPAPPQLEDVEEKFSLWDTVDQASLCGGIWLFRAILEPRLDRSSRQIIHWALNVVWDPKCTV
ncbi:hypothetical protein N7508_001629 [Penicillium antarcticum]|uniref:uncharacterized protein n=1 Tax=Penicillium antarcticum TaxID=416450 RepID=UPI002396FA46|nr:uncharacterized protein N7508_001629 [Penicillium antarcticum]KAJ5317121.1 hypothetical protein N7508_001629 [Penicillium antarcticum]